MCGRYRLSRRTQMIEDYFETAEEVDWEPRYKGRTCNRDPSWFWTVPGMPRDKRDILT